MTRRGCLSIVALLTLLLMVVVGWTGWQASDWSLPPIARGIDRTFSTGDTQFKTRIKNLYPVGSSEQRLLDDLKEQGFDIDLRPGDLSMADLHRFIECGDKVWSVRWRASESRITEIFGVYGPVCL